VERATNRESPESEKEERAIAEISCHPDEDYRMWEKPVSADRTQFKSSASRRCKLVSTIGENRKRRVN